MNRSALRGAWALVVACGICGMVGGCQNEVRVQDPMLALQNERESVQVREAAVTQALSQGGDDAVALGAIADALGDVAESERTPASVRKSAINALTGDARPAVQARAREVVRRVLPDEANPAVVESLCKAAAANGWVECAPAILTRYAKAGVPGVADSDRPERAALLALFPGKSVEEVAWEQVVNPADLGTKYGVNWTRKLQQDAWGVLSRLDAGGVRAGMLARVGSPGGTVSGAGKSVLDALRAASDELHALPGSAGELEWLMHVRSSKSPAVLAWWKGASAGAASARGRGEGLSLRHAEAVRWAGEHRAEWLSMEKDALVGVLQERLAERKFYERSQGQNRVYREGLAGQEAALAWGDVLAMLVIDEALRAPGMADVLSRQADMDQADVRAEYGGVLALRAMNDAAYAPVMYLPRAAQRVGDLRFVPTPEMLELSETGLAIFHFHARKMSGADEAGPDEQDLAVAAAHGRMSVLLTRVGAGKFDVDVYLPSGTVVDLGGL